MQTWPMRALLEDDGGRPIADAAGWEAEAARIRHLFFQTLGEKPASQRLHGFEVGTPQTDGDVIRTLITIDMDDDDRMEAWLLEPPRNDPPKDCRHDPRLGPGSGNWSEPAVSAGMAAVTGAILVPHQTTALGKDEPAGVLPGKRAPYGLELARRGHVVLCPDAHAVNRRYARELKAYDTTHFYERFPHWSSVGKIIADHVACLDVLEKLPQATGKPMGVIGHSLGGQTAIYAALADTRIRAAVCNSGIFPFADSRGRGEWFRDRWYIYFKDAALKRSVLEGPQPLWDCHELAALIAPRALWLGGAPNDYCSGSIDGLVKMTRELHELWRMLGADNRLACIIHNEGHDFSRWLREAAYAWLEAQLQA